TLPPARSRDIESRSASESRQVLEFLNHNFGLILQRDLSLIKDVQIYAGRVSTGGGHSRSEDVPINYTRAVCITRPRHSLETYLAWFPAERVRENTNRHTKSNEVGRNKVVMHHVVGV